MKSTVANCAATLAVACVAASSFCSMAAAADLYGNPNRGSIKDGYQQPVSALPVWQGLYIGANVGYGWSRVKDPSDPFTVKGNGIVGGVHGGYNHQVRMLVLGIEGDFNWSDVRGRATVPGFDATIDTHHRTFSSVRGRLGIAFDRAMIYGTAGYGWTDVRVGANDGVTSASQSKTTDGLVWGGGIEYKLNPNLSLRAEALRFETSGSFRADDGTRVKIDTPATEVRAGLTWHINTWR